MKIYVGNLPFSVDDTQLRSLFSQFGEVESASIVMDRDTGRPRGFGFVEMPDEDARKAIKGLENHSMGGRTLNVNEARARENGGGGGGGGGGRSGGGRSGGGRSGGGGGYGGGGGGYGGGGGGGGGGGSRW